MVERAGTFAMAEEEPARETSYLQIMAQRMSPTGVAKVYFTYSLGVVHNYFTSIKFLSISDGEKCSRGIYSKLTFQI